MGQPSLIEFKLPFNQVDLDEAMASQDELADLEWEGHVADKVWEVN